MARHAAGLLCLTGCREGAVAAAALMDDEKLAVRAAGQLADIFGRDRVWVELQRHWLPDDTRLGARLLAVAQRDRPSPRRHERRPLRDRSRITGCGISCLPRSDLITLTELAARPGSHNSNEFYLKGAAEMRALFSDLPEALAATQAIAERCHVSMDFSGRRTPAFAYRSPDFAPGIPPGETAFSYLHTLCYEGLRNRFKPVTPQAVKQLAHELTVIEKAGLADYFLIVWDIVRYARNAGIRCQGRGSAANSLAAYVLGITPVDPLRHNLLFERFLSERTDTMPDIDIDFAADRRDEVIEYVYRQYGTEHAAMVCNIVTYQWRLAVRDVAARAGLLARRCGPHQRDVGRRRSLKV